MLFNNVANSIEPICNVAIARRDKNLSTKPTTDADVRGKNGQPPLRVWATVKYVATETANGIEGFPSKEGENVLKASQ